jgi:dsDNA-specific endonuclease/ATPase MutS2
MELLAKIRSWLRGSKGENAESSPRHDAHVDDQIDPFDPFPDTVILEITDVFDLHSISPGDTEKAVKAYLEEARQREFRSVRIIHGKGIGVQRELVRKVLERSEFVESFTDAPPQSGGWGATVAHLKRKAG